MCKIDISFIVCLVNVFAYVDWSSCVIMYITSGFSLRYMFHQLLCACIVNVLMSGPLFYLLKG